VGPHFPSADDWPEMTTYFDAEIIGGRHGFMTGKWGATDDEDLKHWARFPAFKQLRSELEGPRLTMPPRDRGVIFMRWKERFLVPDHRVQDVSGASFAGQASVLLRDAHAHAATDRLLLHLHRHGWSCRSRGHALASDDDASSLWPGWPLVAENTDVTQAYPRDAAWLHEPATLFWHSGCTSYHEWLLLPRQL
jgi:hypothetical protein